MSDTAYFVPIPAPENTDSARDDTPPGTHIEHFRPTRHTVSTWGPDLQHGAPPSALLVRALERHRPRPGTRLSRICIDLLGPVPLTDIEVRTRIDRPGHQIELVIAELWATAPGSSRRAVARGTAWRLQTRDLPDVARTSEPALTPVDPAVAPTDMTLFGLGGYIDTINWHIVTPLGAPGQSAAWVRARLDLVEGEALNPIERLFTVADVANGIGSKLDPAHWLFLNTDLTVHLFREPDSDWTGISAETSVGPDGIGMTTGVLHDEHGPLGRITQNVQVRPR